MTNSPVFDSGTSSLGESEESINISDTNQDQDTFIERDIKDAIKEAATTTDNGTVTSFDDLVKPTDAITLGGLPWRLIRQFGKEGDKEGELREANAIVRCPNGNIAVTNLNINMNSGQVYFFNKDGVFKSTLQSPTAYPKDELLFPWDLAVTSQGYLVLTDQSKYVKIFDANYTLLCSLCVLTSKDDPNTEVNTCGVAVTPQDDILVADHDRQLITMHEHTQTNTWSLRKILRLPIKPIYLATNRQRQAVVSNWKESKVIGLNFEKAKISFTIDDFKADGKTGVPKGVTCTGDGDVFIAVMAFNENTGKVIAGTGHIHQYDSTGVFTRCIDKGLYVPRGITLSRGSLFVANETSVLVYSRYSSRHTRRRCTVTVMTIHDM